MLRLPAFVLVFAWPLAAWPCSPIPGASPAGLPAEIRTSSPLLVAEGEAQLFDNTGSSLSLDEVSPDPLLAGARGTFKPLRFFRPSAPLPEGAYELRTPRASSLRFSVVAGEPAVPEQPAADTTLTLFIDNEDDSVDAFGCASLGSCGDLTNLRIALPSVPESFDDENAPAFLVRFEWASGQVVKRLVSDRYASGGTSTSLLFYDGVDNQNFRDEPVCLSVRGVSPSGAVSEARDLGCTSPPGGGCAGLPRRRIPTLFLLVLLVGTSRWLARRTERRSLTSFGV